jgi:hypothetical protein
MKIGMFKMKFKDALVEIEKLILYIFLIITLPWLIEV